MSRSAAMTRYYWDCGRSVRFSEKFGVALAARAFPKAPRGLKCSALVWSVVFAFAVAVPTSGVAGGKTHAVKSEKGEQTFDPRWEHLIPTERNKDFNATVVCTGFADEKQPAQQDATSKKIQIINGLVETFTVQAYNSAFGQNGTSFAASSRVKGVADVSDGKILKLGGEGRLIATVTLGEKKGARGLAKAQATDPIILGPNGIGPIGTPRIFDVNLLIGAGTSFIGEPKGMIYRGVVHAGTIEYGDSLFDPGTPGVDDLYRVTIGYTDTVPGIDVDVTLGSSTTFSLGFNGTEEEIEAAILAALTVTPDSTCVANDFTPITVAVTVPEEVENVTVGMYQDAEASGMIPREASFALQLDGTNDYVTFGQALGTGGLGVSTFTLELWFYRTGAGAAISTGTGGVQAVPLITKGRGEADGSTLDMNFFLGIREGDNVLCADYEEGTGQTSPGLNHPVAGVTRIVNDTWYHAAATFDGTRWRLYLNGLPEAELEVGENRLPQNNSVQHAGLATAMASTGATGGFFAGAIDEPRVWSVARTQGEIEDDLYSDLDGGTGLIGRWGLNEGTGLSAGNTIVPGVAGTLTNGPTWVAGRPQPPWVGVLYPVGGETFDVGQQMTIEWTAGDDIEVTSIDLLLSRTGVGGSFEPIGMGLPNTGNYLWTVTGPETHEAFLKVIAYDGESWMVSDTNDSPFVILAPTGIVEERVTEFALDLLSSNPIRGVATFGVAIPRQSRVRLVVYDVVGREVAVVADGVYPPGRHAVAWDGRTSRGEAASGVYFVRMEALNNQLTRKIVFVR